VERGEAVVAGLTRYVDDAGAGEAEQQRDHPGAAVRGRHHERRARLVRLAPAVPETDLVGQVLASPRERLLHPVSIILRGELEQSRELVPAPGDLGRREIRKVSHCLLLVLDGIISSTHLQKRRHQAGLYRRFSRGRR
jgi:hypothetical protein